MLKYYHFYETNNQINKLPGDILKINWWTWWTKNKLIDFPVFVVEFFFVKQSGILTYLETCTVFCMAFRWIRKIHYNFILYNGLIFLVLFFDDVDNSYFLWNNRLRSHRKMERLLQKIHNHNYIKMKIIKPHLIVQIRIVNKPLLLKNWNLRKYYVWLLKFKLHTFFSNFFLHFFHPCSYNFARYVRKYCSVYLSEYNT